MEIRDIIHFIREHGSELAEPIPMGDLPEMSFACNFSDRPIEPLELVDYFVELPSDVCEFWSTARSASLFRDVQYGQWGLDILDPKDAHESTRRFSEERRRDFEEGDLVIGSFLGDSDLLLVRCDPSCNDFGEIQVALPLDRRADWYRPASTFASFLEQYARAGGAKYWCAGSRDPTI